MTGGSVFMYLGLFFLVLLAIAGYQLFVICLNMRRLRRYRRARFEAITQRRFGKLRHRLVRLSQRGSLSDRSVTFLNFYLICTYIIRNPHEYEEIARYLADNMMNSRIHDSRETQVDQALKSESMSWTAPVKEYIEETASNIEDLMIFNTPIVRGLYLWGKRIRGIVGLVGVETVPRTRAIELVASMSSVDRTFLEVRDALRALAGPSRISPTS